MPFGRAIGQNSTRESARESISVLFGLFVVVLVFVSVAILRFFSSESSPVARGAEFVDRSCLNCHSGDVSRLDCGNRRRDHVVYDGSCSDLQAYFASYAVWTSFSERLAVTPGNRLLMGEQLARKFYCFECHGDLGQGGTKNHGSLKGYIPGFFGQDFADLTSGGSRQSISRWVTRGVDDDIASQIVLGSIANLFFQRQQIKMPSFSSLDPQDLDLLTDYVLALNSFGPMDARAVKCYDHLTRILNYRKVSKSDCET